MTNPPKDTEALVEMRARALWLTMKGSTEEELADKDTPVVRYLEKCFKRDLDDYAGYVRAMMLTDQRHGVVSVPAEATEEMINTGGVAVWDSSPADFHDLSREACRSAAIPCWSAMRAAGAYKVDEGKVR